MITYGSLPTLTFDLDDNLNRHTNQANVKNDIKTKPYYTGGATATGDALKFARDRVLQESHGMRPNSKKTILLLTDGHYNHGIHNPINVAEDLFQAFNDQLSIVALGIGNNIDYQELIDITKHYNPANPLVFFTETFYSFHDIVVEIKSLLTDEQAICSADVLVKKR
ncbi:collagen alpha-1(XII) chain-like [Corticium candelabrum]|uniref:collagen alpha-1(XII) chain-like n=1 Tax=Corticium candelabrum TaxID=121492 RepID=UPI002E26A29F|nr:collagen alpha-1(XII) chain-like [Corticium candelabrum]